MLVITLIISSCSTNQKEVILKNDQTHPLLQMRTAQEGVGVNIHFFEGNKKDLLMLKESGVGIVRMDVSWISVEKEKGEYDLSRHDKLIEDLDKLGIRLLFIIDYGNPNYDGGLAPHTKEGRDAYIKFCSALAERYSGKNIIWELWNEPNIDKFWTPAVNVDDYVAFCKAVVPAIRKKDLDACIIAPATSAFDMNFMEACFEQGLLELVDGVSVHPYRNPELSPETIFDEYQLLSILINEHKPEGKIIPIVSGEWGYSTFYLSRELQGKYLARQWLSNYALNIPISIWYDWHDDGEDPNEAEHNFGTVTWNYKKKPSFVAMKTFTDELSGYKTLGRISLGSLDDYMVLFQRKDKIKIAIWSTSEFHNLDLGDDFVVSKSVDYLGHSISNLSGVNIGVSDEPIFIELAKPYPNWVKMVTKINRITKNETTEFVNSFESNSSDNELNNNITKILYSENPMQRRVSLYSLLIIANKTSAKTALKIYYRILESSKDVLSSKLAMLGIAKIASTESLGNVALQMNDEKLFKESALYFLNLSYKMVLKGKYEEAEKLLTDAIKLSPQRYAVERVLNLMEKNRKGINPNHFRAMANSAGFINDWFILGPFEYKNKISGKEYISVKNIDISKSINYDNLTMNWKHVELNGVFPIIPLAKYYGRIKSDAYAFTEISMREKKSAILKIGSNDGVICWVNGKKVHEKIVGRALTIDEDIVKVNLKKGKNQILLKVINDGNAWEACLRVCDSNGVAMNINNLKK